MGGDLGRRESVGFDFGRVRLLGCGAGRRGGRASVTPPSAVIAHSGHSCRRCDSAPSSTERSDWRIINAGQLDGWVGGGGHFSIERTYTTHIITSSFEIQEYYLGTATQKEWKFICLYVNGDG